MVTLARFTPSLLDGETLERLFVVRERLLADTAARVERASHGPERAHKLFVGPRGSGKTHLISLVHHRAKQLDGYGTSFQLSWLPEDPWTITALDDLLQEIVGHLEPPPVESRGDPYADIMHATREHGPVVVLLENLDQALGAIGPHGQRRFRALLENERPLLLIGSATRLSEALSDQPEPFYGFFDTTTLVPFDVNEAVTMLQAIAKEDNDEALVRRLGEPGAQARLAAIQHLAGGQPRLWALLATALSLDGLEGLVSSLLKTFDDLTPYYQEQLGHLSANERKIVRALADADRPMTVKALAEVTRIEQRSLAKTITELRKVGWVRPRTGLLTAQLDQRLSFYELAEPLARLAFQLKASRGCPVPLVLDFLAAWFERDELAATTSAVPLVDTYLHDATALVVSDPVNLISHSLTGTPSSTLNVSEDPTVGRYAPLQRLPQLDAPLSDFDDALSAYQHGNALPLLEQPSALSLLAEQRLAQDTVTAVRIAVSRLGLAHLLGDPETWVGRAEDVLTGATDGERLAALLNLLQWHLRAGQGSAASIVAQQAIHIVSAAPNPDNTAAVISTGEQLIRSGSTQTAGDLLEAVYNVVPTGQLLAMSTALQAVYFRTGQPARARTIWDATLQRLLVDLGDDDPSALRAMGSLGVTVRAQGDLRGARRLQEELLVASRRVLGDDHPETLKAMGNLAITLSDQGDLRGARRLQEELLVASRRVLGDDHTVTLATIHNLAGTLLHQGDLAAARKLLEQALEARRRTFGPEHPDTLGAMANLGATLHAQGDLAGARQLEEQVLGAYARTLGPEHPDTLMAMGNLAATLGASGDIATARQLEQEVLDAYRRILGPEHPDALRALGNLATTLHAQGDFAGARQLQEQVLEARKRTLGPEHPDTLMAMGNLATTLGTQGDLPGARQLQVQALDAYGRTLGPRHPATLVASKNLLLTLQAQGDFEAARHLEDEVPMRAAG